MTHRSFYRLPFVALVAMLGMVSLFASTMRAQAESPSGEQQRTALIEALSEGKFIRPDFLSLDRCDVSEAELKLLTMVPDIRQLSLFRTTVSDGRSCSSSIFPLWSGCRSTRRMSARPEWCRCRT